MRTRLGLFLVVAGFGGAALVQGVPMALAAGPRAAVLEIDEPVLRATARFLDCGVQKASDDGARVLVVTLDTPGGLFDTTKDIVNSILDSPVPVVVYVSPQGARAASAGTFITVAAHVAAMSPVSTIGAATPMSKFGEIPTTAEAKAIEDAVAEFRSIAEARGRNIEGLIATVRSAPSYSASKALDNGVIEIIATNVADLLAQLDGRTVCIGKECTVTDGRFEGGELLVLDTEGLQTFSIEKTLLESFLGFLANPTLLSLLLTLGAIGVFIEFVSGAGVLLPGITGIIALALAFLGLGELPTNVVGIVLIGLSVVLFVIELKAPWSFGFGVAGLIAFALGGFLLVGDFALPGFTPEPLEVPDLRVNPWVVGATTAGLGAILMFLVRSILGARSPGTSEPTSVASLMGQTGTVNAALAPAGTMQVAGELWSAISDSGETIDEGTEVLVTEAEGLTLKVSKPAQPSNDADNGPTE